MLNIVVYFNDIIENKYMIDFIICGGKVLFNELLFYFRYFVR